MVPGESTSPPRKKAKVRDKPTTGSKDVVGPEAELTQDFFRGRVVPEVEMAQDLCKDVLDLEVTQDPDNELPEPEAKLAVTHIENTSFGTQTPNESGKGIDELLNEELNGISQINWGEWSINEDEEDKQAESSLLTVRVIGEEPIQVPHITLSEQSDGSEVKRWLEYTQEADAITIFLPDSEGSPSGPDEAEEEDFGNDPYLGPTREETLALPQLGLPDVRGTKEYFYEAQHRFLVHEKLGWSKSRHSLAYAIKSVRDSSLSTLFLRGEWADEAGILVGEEINLVEPRFDSTTNSFIIDYTSGFLILCPDILISVTSIMGTFFCERKAVLSERIRLPFDSVDALRGVIAHELIGRAMKEKTTSLVELKLSLNQILKSPPIMVKAYGLELSNKDLRVLGSGLIPYVMKVLQSQKNAYEVIDIEDNFWNPAFGLKGKIDATARYQAEDGTSRVGPLEYKTGDIKRRAANDKFLSHIGQVQLYSLLMSRRYKTVDSVMLLYIREDNFQKHKVARNILRPLMIKRNRLVISQTIRDGKLGFLPDINVGYNVCEKCEYRDVCSAITRTSPEVRSRTTTETALVKYSRKYLSRLELSFFLKWFKVITLETQFVESSYNVRNLWTTSIDKREKSGKCLGYLKHVSTDHLPVTDGLIVQFRRENQDVPYTVPAQNLDFKAKDFVILGTHDELCITYATVLEIGHDPLRITLRIDRPITETLPDGINSTRFTVDKVCGTSPIMAQYGYLQTLMGNSPGPTRLRRYLLKITSPILDMLFPRDLILKHGILERFNKKQQLAIVRAVQTNSYILVQGMPGTGKTRTVAGLIELLVRMGNSVLVSAHTGTAVDNILTKLSECGLDFLRVGEPKLDCSQIKSNTVSNFEGICADVDELTEVFSERKVVATTLLSLKHELFRRRRFDYVIIDEGSQALPASCFGALCLADKFVVFGDPFQLPSVMRPEVAELVGQDDSIYNMLTSGKNTYKLKEQYRMNGAIMDLANRLVYQGLMTCSEEQKVRVLELPSSAASNYLERIQSGDRLKWMSSLLSRRLSRSVFWLNTSGIEAFEERQGESLKNEEEANLVHEIIQMYIEVGVDPEDIGVIAPYRAQVDNVRRKLNLLGSAYQKVEVNTVDQYQGRDKTVIVCTFTKSREKDNGDEFQETKGGILQDLRRLNVAITRAKLKLIMIGNLDYLAGTFEPFTKLRPLLDKDWQVHKLLEPVYY